MSIIDKSNSEIDNPNSETTWLTDFSSAQSVQGTIGSTNNLDAINFANAPTLKIDALSSTLPTDSVTSAQREINGITISSDSSNADSDIESNNAAAAAILTFIYSRSTSITSRSTSIIPSSEIPSSEIPSSEIPRVQLSLNNNVEHKNALDTEEVKDSTDSSNFTWNVDNTSSPLLDFTGEEPENEDVI